MKKLLLMFCLLFFVCLLGQAKAGPYPVGYVLLFDNFNSENSGVGALNYNKFLNWDVVDGTVDLIGNGYFDFLPGNGLYVDMDGSTNDAGKLLSKTIFAFEPGMYELKFKLAGNQRNNAQESVIVQVAMGGLFNKTYSLARTAPFISFTETFLVTSLTNAKLSFEGTGGDNIGMLLDDVQLTAIPEPGTLLLLGTGLLSIAGLSLLRRKQR